MFNSERMNQINDNGRNKMNDQRRLLSKSVIDIASDKP